MKKTTSLTGFFAITLLCVSFLSSCKKDEDTTPASSFSVDRDALKGSINDGTVTLESGTYKLTGPLYVKSGATLKINAGVIVESQGNGAEGFIAVEQGGKIDAQGTTTNPIVFTSSVKSAGSWGGIVLCGKAPINKGTNAQAEVTGLIYGGTDATDNSGIMKYCIIEYSGNKISGTKEFNGLNFFGVGSGTTIEYIQVREGSDDAFEWFGGTVNCKYLVATNFEDDGFDWTEGWAGKLDYGYAVNNMTVASDDSRGIEADNLEGNFSASPASNPTLNNITLVGRTTTPTAGSQKEGVKLRRGTKGILTNVVVRDYSTSVNIENDETLTNNTNGSLKLTDFDVSGTLSGKKSDGTSATIQVGLYLGTNGAGNGASKPTWANTWTK